MIDVGQASPAKQEKQANKLIRKIGDHMAKLSSSENRAEPGVLKMYLPEEIIRTFRAGSPRLPASGASRRGARAGREKASDRLRLSGGHSGRSEGQV
jgi:hypothetical protein